MNRIGVHLIHPSSSAGFTIIEVVAVIVISGILGIGVVGFINNATDSITTSTQRSQLASAGRVAVDRLALELHNALPNSIRTTTAAAGGDQCIEFIPVRAATSYINPPFTSAGTTFDVVDFVPSEHGATSGYAVIYPRRQNQMYDGDNGPSAGWPNFPTRRPIQEITSIADSTAADQSTVTLVKSHRFRRRSPSQRFFLVEDPISYCVVGDKLYRYTNYGFYTSQTAVEVGSAACGLLPTPTCLPNYSSAPDKMLITDSIDNTGLSAFSVGTQTLTRNSIVKIDLNMSANGESIRVNHEVLTRSVP